jgi:transcriptional regulator
MTRAHTNLLKGTLDLLILGALQDQPRHGYGISAWIRESTREACSIEEGTLYPALHRLEAKAWIVADWGLSENNRRAKFYRLTAAGERRLEAERSNWDHFASAVQHALDIPRAHR